MSFRSGFVNIVGKPNVGKSTLINALLGEKVSIVSPKIQTTRHRILGILNGENYQIVFSDTPGFIAQPRYKMHEAMMKSVYQALEDGDVLFFIVDVYEKVEKNLTLDKILKSEKPVYLLLNKIDRVEQNKAEELMKEWNQFLPMENIIPVSALKKFNLERVIKTAVEKLPEHPPYFPADQYTDRTERFLASEVIREKIFLHFKQEIPYSTEVAVTAFKEEENIIRISAEIFVERRSQKGILIGQGGEALKRVGTQARLEMEKQFGKKVFLELFVKVREDWRENKRFLREFGYE
jgi:GTP-binding protein Era